MIVGYDGLVLYANVNNIFTLRTESANHVALIYQDRPLRSVNGILMWLSPSSPTASSLHRTGPPGWLETTFLAFNARSYCGKNLLLS